LVPAARQSCLPDFDEIAIGVAHVTADLRLVLLWRREELGTSRAPFRVDGLDIRDPDVQEAARAVRIRWRLERDRGLVVGRSATDVDDDPAVGERHVGRFTRADEPGAEDVCVEPNRALYVL